MKELNQNINSKLEIAGMLIELQKKKHDRVFYLLLLGIILLIIILPNENQVDSH